MAKVKVLKTVYIQYGMTSKLTDNPFKKLSPRITRGGLDKTGPSFTENLLGENSRLRRI